MIGLDEIGALAHAMEDVLAGARDGGSVPAELVDPLLRAADALRRHVDGDGEPVAELIAELTAPPQASPRRARPARSRRPRPAPRSAAPASAARSACRPRRSTRCSTSSARPCSTAAGWSTRSAASAPRRPTAVSDELDLGERLLDG